MTVKLLDMDNLVLTVCISMDIFIDILQSVFHIIYYLFSQVNQEMYV